MTLTIHAEVGPFADEYLALEADAAAAYNGFVFGDPELSVVVRRRLLELDVSEFGPPYGKALVDDGRPVGMLACLTADDLARRRLQTYMTLRKMDDVDEDALRRLECAGHAFLKPTAGDMYLSRLAVAGDSRRRGLGGVLLARFEEEGRAAGCHRFTLDVDAASRDAIAFYHRHGYERVGLGEAVDARQNVILCYEHMAKDASP